MIDITLIRANPDAVKAQLAKLFDPTTDERIDRIVALDQERRALLTRVEAIQQNRNALNKAFGRLRGDKALDDDARLSRAARAVAALEADDLTAAVAILSGEDAASYPAGVTPDALDRLTATLGGLSETVEALNRRVGEIETQLDDEMLWVPNLPHESVPVYESDEHNIPSEPRGILREFSFAPKPHWDLGVEIDLIDFERGVKLAGSRGYILKGWGARLQRALSNFFLDTALRKGYRELYVPFFVKEEMMVGAGQFPKFRDVVYYDPDADVYMIPTAEVAITNMYRDEILPEEVLPLNFVAHTPCFRREKMSAGKDVRGIKRVHQFQKVEMYKFTTPDASYAALDDLVRDACDLCDQLGLPYRTLEIVSGDLGFSASKKYDIEVWSPGCGEWLEVSSCSNTEAFQARRANLKYRPTDRRKSEYLHTLNGSGLATPRVLIAILENYQRPDGSIEIPAVLRPYLGGAEVIPAAGG